MFNTENSSGKASAPSPAARALATRRQGSDIGAGPDADVRAATTVPCPMSTPASAAHSPTANEKS